MFEKGVVTIGIFWSKCEDPLY